MLVFFFPKKKQVNLIKKKDIKNRKIDKIIFFNLN